MPGNNDHFFYPPEETQTYLRARGFLPDGRRSGGIKSPVKVEVPAGAVLVRMFEDPDRRYGEWWATPGETEEIGDYFGRGGPAFGEGREEGRGILQATFVVRHDWGGKSPGHLGRFFAVRLNVALTALYGEGDVAPDDTQKQVQKAALIIDRKGIQRAARQVFLPKPYLYTNCFSELIHGSSDTDLLGVAHSYGWPRLPFE